MGVEIHFQKYHNQLYVTRILFTKLNVVSEISRPRTIIKNTSSSVTFVYETCEWNSNLCAEKIFVQVTKRRYVTPQMNFLKIRKLSKFPRVKLPSPVI